MPPQVCMDVKTDDVVAESPPWFATALRAPVELVSTLRNALVHW
jgi:hypothetical protein